MLDMSNVLNLVTENWRIVAIAAAVLCYFGWDKAKALVGKIKLPISTKESTKNHKAIEEADVAAIARLRDRAIEYNNEALLKDIKNVSSQFFDLHCNPTRINGKSV